MTRSYMEMAKISVTLTFMPSPMSVVTAGRPASVAGTLIMTLGRSIVLEQAAGFGHGGVGIVSEVGIDLDADEAVAGVGFVVDGPE